MLPLTTEQSWATSKFAQKPWNFVYQVPNISDLCTMPSSEQEANQNNNFCVDTTETIPNCRGNPSSPPLLATYLPILSLFLQDARPQVCSLNIIWPHSISSCDVQPPARACQAPQTTCRGCQPGPVPVRTPIQRLYLFVNAKHQPCRRSPKRSRDTIHFDRPQKLSDSQHSSHTDVG